MDVGKTAAERMVAVAPEDPTSYYTASKMAKEFGEMDKSLACLRHSLALAKTMDSPFYIAQYALSVGFCSVQVRYGMGDMSWDGFCKRPMRGQGRSATADLLPKLAELVSVWN